MYETWKTDFSMVDITPLAMPVTESPSTCSRTVFGRKACRFQTQYTRYTQQWAVTQATLRHKPSRTFQGGLQVEERRKAPKRRATQILTKGTMLHSGYRFPSGQETFKYITESIVTMIFVLARTNVK